MGQDDLRDVNDGDFDRHAAVSHMMSVDQAVAYAYDEREEIARGVFAIWLSDDIASRQRELEQKITDRPDGRVIVFSRFRGPNESAIHLVVSVNIDTVDLSPLFGATPSADSMPFPGIRIGAFTFNDDQWPAMKARFIDVFGPPTGPGVE